MISTIDPPDFRTRVRILKKKAMLNGYCLPEDVIHYLAEELTADIRQLESGLIGVAAKASLMGLPIDHSLAENIVKDISKMRKTITVETIKKVVCIHFKVKMPDLGFPVQEKAGCGAPADCHVFVAKIHGRPASGHWQEL